MCCYGLEEHNYKSLLNYEASEQPELIIQSY